MSAEPLDDALAILRLDAEDVLVTAEAANGYGSLLARTPKRGHLARAATMKIRAAACWSLVSPVRAPSAFAEASRLYERLGRSFAIVAAICAGERQLPAVDPRLSTAPDDLACRALWLAWGLASGDMLDATAALEDLDRSAENVEWCLAGHLEVPLHLYLEFVAGIARAVRSGDPSRELTRSLPRFLERASEPVRMAMADRYHWQAIGTGIMPVEPELLAVGRVAHRALGEWDEDRLTHLGIPRYDVERLPLWIARALEEPPDGSSWLSGPGERPLPPDGVDSSARTWPLDRNAQDPTPGL